MKRGDGEGSQDQAPAFLGYCPQENPLWLDLTPQQHLRVYAAVKGLRQEDTAAAVHRYRRRAATAPVPPLSHGEGTRESKFTEETLKGTQETQLQKRCCAQCRDLVSGLRKPPVFLSAFGGDKFTTDTL